MDSVFDNVHRKRNLPRKIPTHHTIFEDNPGDLPADAIKSDDDFMAHDQEMDQKYSKHDESKETDQHGNHEITINVSETLNDTDIDNQHGFQEKVRKKEQKQKPNDTQSFEETTKPFKHHTENMITAKKKTENEVDLQDSNRKKQDKKTTEANEGVDDQENRMLRDKGQEKKSMSFVFGVAANFDLSKM